MASKADAGSESPFKHDPISLTVIINRFYSIANEMTLTLELTAYTSIIALARDFSCAVYDVNARQIVMYDALPIHTTSQHLVLGEIARSFEGRIHDGDLFLCNDPYRFNTHVGDLVTACPVFVDGEHLFWTVTKGHQLDTGAFVASSVTAASQNVWQEGIQIPPVKIVDKGEERTDVVELYLANVRYRELLRGDLMAQVGSVMKGRERLIELCDEYGTSQIVDYVDYIIDYADRRMADEIAGIPDGDYHGEGWIDSDGVDTTNIPVKVKVTIAGERVFVDFSGTGTQAKGGMNGSIATSQATAAIPFLCYIDPEIPHNHGCIKHIEVFLPKGTICNPIYPASTSCATIVPSDMMHDAINKAMASAIPDRVPAGGPRCAAEPTISGIDERTGEAWGTMLFNCGGGQGASKDTDGWPLFLALAGFGGLKSLSVEQIELLYPLLVEQMEIEPDSMGLGASIGGPGVRLVVAPVHGPVEVVTFGDGCANPPHGVLGGTQGIGGGQYVENRSTGRRLFYSASGRVEVGMDEVWVGVSTGGGGYGNPLDRDVERVRDNVRDGLVCRKRALDVYGVVVGNDLNPAVEQEATSRRREDLVAIERPTIEPTKASSSTWLQDNMEAGDEYVLNPR